MPEIIFALGLAAWTVWRWRRLGLSVRSRTYLVLAIAVLACVVMSL